MDRVGMEYEWEPVHFWHRQQLWFFRLATVGAPVHGWHDQVCREPVRHELSCEELVMPLSICARLAAQ